MAKRESSRRIDADAAGWVARLDRGPLSEAEKRALEEWLSGDPRRRGALLRADAVSMLSESARALGPQYEPAQFVEPETASPVSRRTLLAWAGAGGIAAASLLAFAVSAPAAATITTGLGEVRRVTLDDGSTIMLNSQTSVSVRNGGREGPVELLAGEAYFKIVQDSSRPFRVDVAGCQLRALRATFCVRRIETNPLEFLVDEGRVAVALPGEAETIMVPAESRLVLPVDGGPPAAPQPLSADRVSRELAWRDGMIAFEGERLDQAAAAFARYSKTRIEIGDPSLAREPVTGLFAASDPVGFARAVASLFDAEVERRGDAVILQRRSASS